MINTWCEHKNLYNKNGQAKYNLCPDCGIYAWELVHSKLSQLPGRCREHLEPGLCLKPNDKWCV